MTSKEYDEGFTAGYRHRAEMEHLPGEPRTLKLSSDECAHLAAILLHEREALQVSVDGQPRKTGGVTGQCPIIDELLRKLHALYPEQNWIRFLEE